MTATADDTADRVDRLISLATVHLRKGDSIAAMLLMEEALAAAETLPKKANQQRPTVP